MTDFVLALIQFSVKVTFWDTSELSCTDHANEKANLFALCQVTTIILGLETNMQWWHRYTEITSPICVCTTWQRARPGSPQGNPQGNPQGSPHIWPLLLGFTKFTQLDVVTSQFVIVISCALRARIEDVLCGWGTLSLTACYYFYGS